MPIVLDKLFPGKLPHGFLADLLIKYTHQDERIITGAAVGEDATVIDMGDRLLVAKTDPITFTTDRIGYYAVHINANDIYCMGAEPRWFLANLLLPEKTTHRRLVEQIFAQISDACKAENILYCGGHTEVTLGLDRPIVVGQMLGEVTRDRLVLKSSCQAGDRLLVARPIPLEGTAIIARNKAKELRKAFAPDLVQRCQNLLLEQGLSLRPLCDLAMAAGKVHGMHDPTEGGLYTALHELARATGLGLEIHEERVPILPEGKLLCDHFDLNPYGLIASGSLLLAVPPSAASRILAAYASAGIIAADIGTLTAADQGLRLVTASGIQLLPVFNQDEIVRVL